MALVRRAKLQLLRPDITGGGFYSALRQFLRANHWRTRDASYLENGALDRFLTSQKDNKKPHYKDIVSHYIEQWNRRDAEFFMVERYDYDLGGLTIRVNPEVGCGTMMESVFSNSGSIPSSCHVRSGKFRNI